MSFAYHLSMANICAKFQKIILQSMKDIWSSQEKLMDRQTDGIGLDKGGYPVNIFLFLHKNICCRYSLEVPHAEIRKISILFD